MNIESAEYRYENGQKNTVEVELTDGTHLSVMISENNITWKEIQQWIADGGTVIDNPPE